MHETITKRVFVGGLASEVTSGEITERFSRFGKVSNLSLKTRTDESGNRIKSFAHLDLEGDEASIKKCFSTYHNTKWKGSVLQLQYAKESFLQKLEKEREEAHNQPELGDIVEVKPGQTSQPQHFEVKGPAVPGTPVPGKKDWVVGKYGRVLPILKLKKSYKIKMMKYDPSKHCHAATVFKDDKTHMPTNSSCNKLTWEISTPDTEITKKRKGIFPQTSNSVKKVKKCVLSVADYFRNNQPIIRKVEEEVEFVKVGSGNVNVATKLITSNRFDSDLESDSEGDSLSKNVSDGLQTGKDKWLNGSTRETKLENNENVKLKINEDRGVKNTVLKSTGKELTVSASVSKNSQVRLEPNVKATNGAEGSTFPAVKSSLKVEYSDSICKKIPEFKGLSMLGLLQECSRTCQEKLQPTTEGYLSVDRSDVTMANSAVDESISSRSVSDKSTSVGSSAGLIVQSSLSDGGYNSSANTTTFNNVQHISKLKEQQKQSSQKSSVPVKDTLLPMGNKQPPSSVVVNDRTDIMRGDSAVKNYDSSSSADTDEIIARCKRRKGIVPSTEAVSELTSGNSTVSNSVRKYEHSPEKNKQPLSSVLINDVPDTLGDDNAWTNYDSSSSADTDEIIARCKRRNGMLPSDVLAAETTPSGNPHVSNSAWKTKTNKQANSLVLINDVPSMLGDDSSLTNYDSSSSADTDEIIARCKRRKALVSSAVAVSKTRSGTSDKANSDRKNELGKQADLRPRVNRSSFDANLGLSGISEYPAQPVPTSGLLNNEDRLYDSDLDSNDFELVARKLMEKNVNSKTGSVFNKTLRDGKNDTIPSKYQDSCKKTHGNTKESISIVSSSEVVTSLPVKSEVPVRTSSWIKDSSDKVSQDSRFGHREEVSGSRNVRNDEDESDDEEEESTDGEEESDNDKEEEDHDVEEEGESSDNGKEEEDIDVEEEEEESSDGEEEREDNDVEEEGESCDNGKEEEDIDVDEEEEEESSDGEEESDNDKERENNDVDEEVESSDNDKEEEDIDVDEEESSDGEEENDNDKEREDNDVEEEGESSDGEEESDNDKEEEDHDDCKEISQLSTAVDRRLEVKSDSLKVAENVAGHTSMTRASDKFKNSTVPIIDMNALRFDPTKLQKTGAVVVGQKTGAVVVGQKTGAAVVGQKTGAAVVGQKTGAVVVGQKTGAVVVGQKTGAVVVGQKTGAVVVGQKTGAVVVGQKTGAVVVGQKTGAVVVGQKTGAVVVGQKTGAAVVGQKTAAVVVGQKTGAVVVGQKTGAAVVGQKTGAVVVGKKTGAVVVGQKTGAVVVGQKTGAVVVGKKTGAVVVGQKTGAVVVGQKTGAAVVGQKTGAVVVGQKTGAVVVGQKTGAAVVGQKTAAVVVGQKMGAVVVGKKTVAAGVGQKMGAVVVGQKTVAAGVGQKTGAAGVGQKTGAAVVGQKTGAVVVGKKTGAVVVGQKTGAAVVGQKTGAVVVGQKTGAVVVGQKTGAAVVGQKTVAAVVGQKTGAAVVGQKTGAVVVGKKTLPQREMTRATLSVKKSVGGKSKVRVSSSLVGLFRKKNPDSAHLETPAPFSLLQVFDRQVADVKSDEREENGKLYSNKGAQKVDTKYSGVQPLGRLAEIRPTLVKTYKRKHKEAVQNERKFEGFKRRKLTPPV